MRLSRPQAILFDWDNTLVDTWEIIHHAYSVTLTAMELEPWTLAQIKTRVRKSARDSFSQMFGPRAEEATRIFYQAFEEVHLEMLRALPGTETMLDRLSDAGLPLAVVSNKHGPLLRREADHLGWTPRFHRLVGALDAVEDKPAVAPVELALEGTGIGRGAQVWFVGDTDIDMRCAALSGCQPVLLRAEAPAENEFPEADGLHHVESTVGLVELILTQ
ncbi:MAG: HAD family hydrolase [Pseudomonadota bacterium]